MPPYRKRYAKRSYGRSRSTSRRRRPLGSTFMKRARTRAYANLRTGGLLAIERKFSDFGHVSTGMDNGGTGVANNAVGGSTFSPPILAPTVYRSAVGMIWTVNPTALNVLGTGDSGSDRDGRQVINDSIHLRGMCKVTVGSLGVFTGTLDVGAFIVNLVLVLDTQTNGAAPAGSAVFVNPGDYTAQGIASGQAPFVNLANSKRFRILKHIRRVLEPAIAGFADGNVLGIAKWPWAMDVPLKGMKTNYVADSSFGNGTGPTVASIGDNGIFLFGWIDGSANDVYCSYNSRLRFRG